MRTDTGQGWEAGVAQQVVLIVDANKHRRAMLGRQLKQRDLNVRYASTLTEAQDLINQEQYRLAIFHLNGERRKVYQFCRDVQRDDPDLKIVALLQTMDVDAESRLFDCGVVNVAAAEQTKPGVLCKRIIPHLRPHLDPLSRQNRIHLGEILVDFDLHKARSNGQWKKLCGTQRALLRYFLKHPNRTITHQELQDSDIWQGSVYTHRNGGKAVEMAISKLRKAIELDPRHPRIILTVYGKGYRLAPGIQIRL